MEREKAPARLLLKASTLLYVLNGRKREFHEGFDWSLTTACGA
jgi:hypothetical protein